MNLPNKITLTRIFMIPVFVVFFFVQFPYHYLVSGIIFMLAALTDALDGHIARKYNLVTNLGKFLDPIADKVLVSTALIIMLIDSQIFALGADAFGFGGAWVIIVASICVAIILARELIVSGFRMVAASTGMVLAADMIGKFKTTFQDIAIFVLLVAASIGGTAGAVINLIGLFCFIVATVLTIWSGTNYIVKNIQVLKA